jgi:hypothetical protein
MSKKITSHYDFIDDEQEAINMQNLVDSFSKEDLAKMCSGFSREAMRLTYWLYKKHRDVLRQFEDEELDGHRIEFA